MVSSYSKDLSLPGERIGYLAVHPEIEEKRSLLDGLTLANRILGFVNAPALMQRVIAELQDVTVDTSIYRRRKEIICRVLREAGFKFTEPKGAFYVFPKTPIADDVKFVALLQEQKILTVPGAGFGSPGYMRIAFCVPDEVMSRSAKGFKRAVDKARASKPTDGYLDLTTIVVRSRQMELLRPLMILADGNPMRRMGTRFPDHHE